MESSLPIFCTSASIVSTSASIAIHSKEEGEEEACQEEGEEKEGPRATEVSEKEGEISKCIFSAQEREDVDGAVGLARARRQ